jgi:Zn-dependent metalloprotease
MINRKNIIFGILLSMSLISCVGGGDNNNVTSSLRDDIQYETSGILTIGETIKKNGQNNVTSSLSDDIQYGTSSIWTIGETIKKNRQPLRYMEQPSLDGSSADCMDKTLVAADSCIIDYNDVVDAAQKLTDDIDEQQRYIVHMASGIFNRAFYLLATRAAKDNKSTEVEAIQSTFEVMIKANAVYWSSDSDFHDAACGVKLAAAKYSEKPSKSKVVFTQDNIEESFKQIGIDTKDCPQ